ncbi:hypothetical protein EWM64_g6255 [Hericium alpestre]|uniref:Uncharacterized protein n=1 Tax=Hericium alpestre TaxID=135208 RepID=A0A4Y9ZW70_9AGAM|nr:hypothetical protein EWM64_g6255 [Hericium alpestre]
MKPDSWEIAVDLAIREFRELQQIERSRITLEKRCAVGEDKVLVRITPEVWTSVVAPLVQWEVIEVHITEEEEEVVDTPAASLPVSESRPIFESQPVFESFRFAEWQLFFQPQPLSESLFIAET